MSKFSEAMQVCDAAAKAIAKLEPQQRAGFVLLILEALDNELDDLTPTLEGLQNDIEIRLKDGEW